MAAIQRGNLAVGWILLKFSTIFMLFCCKISIKFYSALFQNFYQHFCCFMAKFPKKITLFCWEVCPQILLFMLQSWSNILNSFVYIYISQTSWTFLGTFLRLSANFRNLSQMSRKSPPPCSYVFKKLLFNFRRTSKYIFFIIDHC